MSFEEKSQRMSNRELRSNPIIFAQIRPIEYGVVERFGKFTKVLEPGLHFLIPFVDKVRIVNITEQMVDVDPQMVITSDKLNAIVDAVVYYKVKDPQAALYHVDDHKRQLSSLARTTLRAVIGKMTLTDANENRAEINDSVEQILNEETKSYGVDILRVEIQRIEPPQDVQEAMNEVVKANNKKIAAADFANAAEIEADGFKRAEIKKAEGLKEAAILEANGKAYAITAVAKADAEQIKLVNESIQKYFVDNAVDYKKLESTVAALKNGTKIIVGTDTELVNVIGDASGVVPIQTQKEMM
ncbi:MAG: SPFH/Band 7/PHB domain protein [Methanococcoides sp.]|nr:SPFH/Band 7/PHB domain protein [Methanococcoides sp.]